MDIELLHLLYHSRATTEQNPADLIKILKVSRRHNSNSSITGCLVYRDGFFLQLLEGAEENVRSTFNRIKNDSRHFSVNVIGECKSHSRLMPTWNMGFVSPERMTTSATNLIELFDVARGKNIFESKQAIQIVLQKFKSDAELLVAQDRTS